MFWQIKIILIPESFLLSKKMYSQLSSLVQEQSRGVQISEVGVTSAFETMKKPEVIQSEE